MKFTIAHASTGALSDPPFASSAAFAPSGYTAYQTAADVELATHDWSATARTWTENIARIEARLVKALKDEAEQRKMALLSPGGAKKTEYAEKRQEVLEWMKLVAGLPVGSTLATILAAFNALPTDEKQLRFPFAIADAVAMGDTIDKAIARFKAGILASANFPVIAAAEQKAIKAVKAASTAAAKQAAAASATWATT